MFKKYHLYDFNCHYLAPPFWDPEKGNAELALGVKESQGCVLVIFYLIIGIYYGLNVYVPLKFICLNPKAWCNSVRWGTLSH